MRFSNLTGSLPCPVLRPDGYESSYEDCDFEFELDVDTSTSPHRLNIKYKIGHPGIKKLVRQRKASVALAIHCGSTYYYDLVNLALKKHQTVTLDEKQVFGNVHFSLIVKAQRPIPAFKPVKLIPTFSGMSFDVRRGDILAVSEEYQELYGLPPMPVGESIFELVHQPELEAEEFDFGLTDQKIRIGVGTKLNELIQTNMNSSDGRIKNIAAVYFPALVAVLYQIQEEPFPGKAWFEAVSVAMASIGLEIDSDNWEPITVAQLLLRSPCISLFEGGV